MISTKEYVARDGMVSRRSAFRPGRHYAMAGWTHKATFGAHFAIPSFGHLLISASAEVDPATKGAKWDKADISKIVGDGRVSAKVDIEGAKVLCTGFANLLVAASH